MSWHYNSYCGQLTGVSEPMRVLQTGNDSNKPKVGYWGLFN